MMALPFFIFTAGLAAIWSGRRNLAFAAWGIGMLVLAALFHAHATSHLDLGL